MLVHRCSHRGFAQMVHFLKAAAQAVPDVKLEYLADLQRTQNKFLRWKDFTEYHAVVLVPHVPNTISFADCYLTDCFGSDFSRHFHTDSGTRFLRAFRCSGIRHRFYWILSAQRAPLPAPPNYPLRDPKYHLIETIRPLIEVHWGV